MGEAIAPAGEPKTSFWNSLEVSKLLLSALTPIALFGLGIIVANSASEETASRDKSIREEARADQAAAEARAVTRETANRDSARRDARQASDLAFERDKALRAEAFARELAMRREADARDARLRTEARGEARRTRSLERRIHVWDEASRMMQEINAGFYGFTSRPNVNERLTNAEWLEFLAKHDRLDAWMNSNLQQFSDAFQRAFHLYHSWITFLFTGATSGELDAAAIHSHSRCLERVFLYVTLQARADIEDSPGPGARESNSSTEAAAPIGCQSVPT